MIALLAFIKLRRSQAAAASLSTAVLGWFSMSEGRHGVLTFWAFCELLWGFDLPNMNASEL